MELAYLALKAFMFRSLGCPVQPWWGLHFATFSCNMSERDASVDNPFRKAIQRSSFTVWLGGLQQYAFQLC